MTDEELHEEIKKVIKDINRFIDFDYAEHHEIWQEIDRRLKVLDLMLKIDTEFSYEYFEEMILQKGESVKDD